MKLYALLNPKTNQLFTVDISSNHGMDFCNETTVTLSRQYDTKGHVWTTQSRSHAETVAASNVEKYNSDIDCPSKDYDRDEIKVVEFILADFDKAVKEIQAAKDGES
jgi:tRNA A58 N-methylase Trm61